MIFRSVLFRATRRRSSMGEDGMGTVINLARERERRRLRRRAAAPGSITLAAIEIAACNMQTLANFWRLMFETILRPRD